MQTTQVFRYDGTLQCNMGKEVPLEVMEKQLTEQGIAVSGRKKGVHPAVIPTVCGAPTGRCNVYEIQKDQIEKALAMQFQWWPFDVRSIEVFKYNGELQCGMGEKIPLDVMAKELENAGVQVISSREMNDGLQHTTVCGAVTGDMNVYQIPSTGWPTAKELGYAWLYHLTLAGGTKEPDIGEIPFPYYARGGSFARPEEGNGVPWPW